MYVYLRSEKSLWTVGFYDPKGNWVPESDHPTASYAAARVAFLNGSNVTKYCYICGASEAEDNDGCRDPNCQMTK